MSISFKNIVIHKKGNKLSMKVSIYFLYAEAGRSLLLITPTTGEEVITESGIPGIIILTVLILFINSL